MIPRARSLDVRSRRAHRLPMRAIRASSKPVLFTRITSAPRGQIIRDLWGFRETWQENPRIFMGKSGWFPVIRFCLFCQPIDFSGKPQKKFRQHQKTSNIMHHYCKVQLRFITTDHLSLFSDLESDLNRFYHKILILFQGAAVILMRIFIICSEGNIKFNEIWHTHAHACVHVYIYIYK